MPLQFKTAQFGDNQITPGKIDLGSGTFDFSEGSAALRANEPVVSNDVATKNYADLLIQGIHWAESCARATTNNIALTGTVSVDGANAANGDRVLVKNNTDASENGIYIVATGGAWSRAPDMNAADEFSGKAMFIQKGTTQADTGWLCSNDGNVVVGTTDITFVQFAGASETVAGNGLIKSGNTISVKLDGGTLAVAAAGLKVDTNGITGNEIAAVTVAAGNIVSQTITATQIANTTITRNQIAANTIQAGQIEAASLGNAEVANNAAILYTKMADVTDGDILIGNGSNKAQARVVSGDVTIGNTGVTAIGDAKVLLKMIAATKSYEVVTINNGTTLFINLANAVPVGAFETPANVIVFNNGQRLRAAADPQDNTEYKVSHVGADTRVTFGGNLVNGSVIQMDYWR